MKTVIKSTLCIVAFLVVALAPLQSSTAQNNSFQRSHVEVYENVNQLESSYLVYSSALVMVNSLYYVDPFSRSIDNPMFIHWYGMAAGKLTVLIGALNIDNTITTEDRPASVCLMNCEITITHQTNHLRTGVSSFNMALGAFSMIRAGYYIYFSKEVRNDSNAHVNVSYLNPGPLNETEPIPALQFSISF